MRKFLILLATFVASPAPACPLIEAMNRLEQYNIQLNSQYAQSDLPLLEELSAITSTAKNPNLPTGQQLTHAQNARFMEIRFELIQHDGMVALNSGYLRDARAIAKAADITHQIRLGRKFAPDSPDRFYGKVAGRVLLTYINKHGEKIDFTSPRTGECSIDAGLATMEELELKYTDTDAALAATKELTEIYNRYKFSNPDGTTAWVEQLPDITVKKHARILAVTVNNMLAVRLYVQMMEGLRELNDATVRMFNANQDDVNRSSDEQQLNAQIGKTWDAMVKAGDKSLQEYDQILQEIAEAIPSESMLKAQHKAETAKQVR
jgi:hypothetical protein